MGRPPCCDKLNVKRGLWTAEEDAKILAYVSKHGTGNWTALPKKAGLRRCGKSCRLRWTNYLRPDLKHDSFTPQEEELIVRLHAAIGSRWSIIALQLPGRTDNDVKNYWNTKLRKKLSEMGIDPVTHKPFSQILADYGNIGCLPKYGTRIGSLTRDLKNAFISKPAEPTEGIITNISNHLVPPKVEPIHECFFNSKNTISTDANNSNHSLDLLDQLQAIKLVTEASSCSNCETISDHFFKEGSLSSLSSSSSSSSSTCSTANQEKSAVSFSWRDFLLEDAFLPSDHPQEQENAMELSSKDLTNQAQNVIPQGQIGCEFTVSERDNVGVERTELAIPSSSFQIPSSSSASFVEAMLHQGNKNFLDFPNLVEEPFSY